MSYIKFIKLDVFVLDVFKEHYIVYLENCFIV